MLYNIINANGEVINTIVYDKDAIDEGLREYEDLMSKYEKDMKAYKKSMDAFYKKYDKIGDEMKKEYALLKEIGLSTSEKMRKLKRELNKIKVPDAPKKPIKPIGHIKLDEGCELVPVGK